MVFLGTRNVDVLLHQLRNAHIRQHDVDGSIVHRLPFVVDTVVQVDKLIDIHKLDHYHRLDGENGLLREYIQLVENYDRLWILHVFGIQFVRAVLELGNEVTVHMIGDIDSDFDFDTPVGHVKLVHKNIVDNFELEELADVGVLVLARVLYIQRPLFPDTVEVTFVSGSHIFADQEFEVQLLDQFEVLVGMILADNCDYIAGNLVLSKFRIHYWFV